MDNKYFDILENAYRTEKQLRKSSFFRMSVKLFNFVNSIKQGFFIENLKREINGRRLRRYSMTSFPQSDFGYGSYPDKNIRIVVYTCVTGGYDNPHPPLFQLQNVDYVLLTDNINQYVDGWQIRQIPINIANLGNGTIINRYFKMHPSTLGDEYDYAVYVDGNIQIISNIRNIINAVSSKTGLAIHRHQMRNCIYDEYEACKILKKGNINKIQEQIKRYKNDGFPPKYGLLECTIIVTDLHNKSGIELLDNWWNEFIKSESLRDQISLPYVLWKNGYIVDDIGNLGYNLMLNPKFKYVTHNNADNKFLI